VRAPPDGYTLLAVDSSPAINATYYNKLKFDFIRDIAPVASIAGQTQIMEVNPSVPAKTVPEFIAYAKANPGKLNMASFGNGNISHVCGELFKMMTGVNMLHVPYRGAGPALADLLGGQVQVCFGGVISAIEYIRAGRLRALAVTTASRLEALQDIPSLSEFLPGYEATDWKGIGMPRNTPPEIIEAQQGDQRWVGRPQAEGAVCRVGLAGASGFPHRLRQTHHPGYRKVGQGGEVRRHQGGLILLCHKFHLWLLRMRRTQCGHR